MPLEVDMVAVTSFGIPRSDRHGRKPLATGDWSQLRNVKKV
jgi:hypothetical protein